MRILVTGANGFIGSQIVAGFLRANHKVTCCARNPESIKLIFPQCDFVYSDFNHDTDSSIWEPRLKNIDVVVNCVGILQEFSHESIKAIHAETPKALFAACEKVGIKKVIQISALGAGQVNTPFAITKNAADEFLQILNLDWIIIRPSLVFDGSSYGGTSLFRALAALPFFVPVVGDGKQLFQPIYMEDLVNAIITLAEDKTFARQIFNAVGPEPVTMEQLLINFRHWLRIKNGKILHVPLPIIKFFAWIAQFSRGPMNLTSLKMLQANIKVDPQPFIKVLKQKPKTLQQALIYRPSQIQDRWHARLYFLRPLLRISLGIVWLLSGLIPLFVPLSKNIALLQQIGISGEIAPVVFYILVMVDVILGMMLLLRKKVKLVGVLQLIVLIGYTLILSIKIPGMWLEPFGSLLKNIPMFIATLVMLAIEDDR